MLKVRDAEKTRGAKKRITDFSSEVMNEKTAGHIFKLLKKEKHLN